MLVYTHCLKTYYGKNLQKILAKILTALYCVTKEGGGPLCPKYTLMLKSVEYFKIFKISEDLIVKFFKSKNL